MQKREGLLTNEQLVQVLALTQTATAVHITEDAIIQMANDAMLNIWGKDSSVIGKSLEDALPELKGQPFAGMFKKVFREGITISGTDTPAQLKVNGELKTFYFDFEYRAVKNEAGETYCILHTAVDVTERTLRKEAMERVREQELALEKEQILNEELTAINEELSQAQQSLHQLNTELEARVLRRTQTLADREMRLSYLLADAPVAIGVLTGREQIVESANTRMLEAWGKTMAIIGLPLHLALPELQGQIFLQLLDEVYTSGQPFYGSEGRVMLERNGQLTEGFFNFVYQPLKDQEGNTHSIMVVANEITDQVMARRRVEASEQELSTMLMVAPMGLAMLKGPRFIIELPNQPMLTIWNRDREQVAGKPLMQVFPELADQPFPAMLTKVYITGKPLAIPEMKAVIGTGEEAKHIYVDFIYHPLKDGEDNVYGVLVAVHDITAIVVARKLLEKSEQEQQELNEELSVTNEELAATNEELIASNEELAMTEQHLHESVKQLTESESRFRFLLNAMPQQVWTATPDGRLDYVNQVVSDDFGQTSQYIIGNGWQAFIHPDDIAGCLQSWASALETGEDYMVEFRLLMRDGNYAWHLGRAVPYRENGVITLWLGTNTNIAIQKSNEQKKDEFLSIASHELKTPITSLKASLQLLDRMKEKPLERMVPVLIDQANKSLLKVSSLIEDLLDTSKVNEGQLHLRKKLFTISSVIDSCCDHIRIVGEYTIVTEGDLELQVVADPERIDQVVINFVNNAVKYAPDCKTIRVYIEKAGDMARVSVTDQGPGIPGDKLPHLFDRYYRADTSGFQYSGLGLGLYICAQIIKKHNGEIGVNSEPGKGSEFWFTIPLK